MACNVPEQPPCPQPCPFYYVCGGHGAFFVGCREPARCNRHATPQDHAMPNTKPKEPPRSPKFRAACDHASLLAFRAGNVPWRAQGVGPGGPTMTCLLSRPAPALPQPSSVSPFGDIRPALKTLVWRHVTDVMSPNGAKKKHWRTPSHLRRHQLVRHTHALHSIASRGWQM